MTFKLLRIAQNEFSHRQRQLMMPKKLPVNHTVLAHSKQYLRNTKREDLAESIGVVSAKYPPKVKLEFLITLEYQSG